MNDFALLFFSHCVGIIVDLFSCFTDVAPGPWKFKVCSVVQPDVCSNDLYFDVQGDLKLMMLHLN